MKFLKRRSIPWVRRLSAETKSSPVSNFVRQHPDDDPLGLEDPFVTLVDRLDPPSSV
jgi:hypothetical protein